MQFGSQSSLVTACELETKGYLVYKPEGNKDAKQSSKPMAIHSSDLQGVHKVTGGYGTNYLVHMHGERWGELTFICQFTWGSEQIV